MLRFRVQLHNKDNESHSLHSPLYISLFPLSTSHHNVYSCLLMSLLWIMLLPTQIIFMITLGFYYFCTSQTTHIIRLVK
jgi:hypothetical protein